MIRGQASPVQGIQVRCASTEWGSPRSSCNPLGSGNNARRLKDMSTLACRQMASALFLTAITFCAQSTTLCAQGKELLLSDVHTRALPFLLFSSIGPTASQDGTVYSTISDKQEVRLLRLADGKAGRLRLHGFSQKIGSWQLGPQVAGDQHGFLYVPARRRQRSLAEGPWSSLSDVLVFRPGGQYDSTIHLRPSVEVRQIIVDELGELFILGIDPLSVYQPTTSPCMLIHKYSRQGTRLARFSECPTLETAQVQSFFLLDRLARRGHLLLWNGSLYHVLSTPRIVRLFNANGSLIRESHLDPPLTGLPGIVGGRGEIGSKDEVA